MAEGEAASACGAAAAEALVLPPVPAKRSKRVGIMFEFPHRLYTSVASTARVQGVE